MFKEGCQAGPGPASTLNLISIHNNSLKTIFIKNGFNSAEKKIAVVTAFKKGFLSVINVNFAFFSFQDLLYSNQKVIIRVSSD